MARILGIDIDGDDVRGVLARTSSRKVEVLQYVGARVEAPGPLPDGSAPGLDARDDALAAAVQQVVTQLSPPPELVVAALDGQEASLRVVELPIGVAKAKKVAETLPGQLDDLLPFDAVDSVVDHQPVDQDATTFRVLATAVPKERVAGRLAELATAGIDPKELAVGAAALDGLRHVIPELASAEIILVVEVDGTRTEVCVLEAGACTFARTLSGGAEVLDAGGASAAQLTMSLRRSIGAYRASGRAPIARVFAAGVGTPKTVLPWLEEVTGVVATPLPMPALPLPAPYAGARVSLPPATTREAGSALEPMAGLAETLEGPDSGGDVPLAALALDEMPRAPRLELAGPGEQPDETGSEDEVPSQNALAALPWARALALAGRMANKGKRLDLRQGEFASTQSLGWVRDHARLVAAAAAAVLLSFAFATYARWSTLSDEREELRAQLGEVTEAVFDVRTDSPSRAKELLEGGASAADPLPRFTAFDALEAISAAVSAEVTHDTRRMTVEVDDVAREGRFEIQGVVASIAERDQIVAALEAHECFQEVDKGPTSNAGDDKLNYRLEVTIGCPGDAPAEEEGSSRRRRNRGR